DPRAGGRAHQRAHRGGGGSQHPRPPDALRGDRRGRAGLAREDDPCLIGQRAPSERRSLAETYAGPVEGEAEGLPDTTGPAHGAPPLRVMDMGLRPYAEMLELQRQLAADRLSG